MNKIIKYFLNNICIFLTWCLNQGQKLMSRIESLQLYRIPKFKNDPDIKREYIKYKKRLNKYGFWAPKRDFYVFRNYLYDKGNDPSLIVPIYIVNNFLTPLFNPIYCTEYFEDKNMYDKILPREYLPNTLFRRINEEWFDTFYNPIKFDEVLNGLNKISINQRVIVKPAKNTSSGKGIVIFEKNDEVWNNVLDGSIFDEQYIENKWKDKDLCLQLVMEQNDYFLQFCSTAVNSMRIVIYNSPVDGKCHLIWGGLKIAANGTILDNVNAGALVFGIDENGKLAPYGADKYGNKFNTINNLDFSKNDFIIPNYDKIIDFCKEVTPILLPNRWISFDIAINKSGQPIIIEYNIRGYSGWSCEFAGDPMFGDKTDEVLEYISINRKYARKVFYSIN